MIFSAIFSARDGSLPCTTKFPAPTRGLVRRALLVTTLALSLPATGQTARAVQRRNTGVERDIDPVLARVIAGTKTIDNHAHPMLSPPDGATDRGFDALPVDNMEAETDPVAWRPDFPGLVEAWRALYGFDLKGGSLPLSAADTKRLEGLRDAVKAREGAGYSAWVLDRAGVGTMLANRVAMGTGVQAPRFRWVPYADALLFPLNNSGMAATSPDRAQFFGLEDKLRAQYLQEAGARAIPGTLEEYLKQVVFPTLTRHRAGGAVAEKFEVAYLRSLDFGDPAREAAAEVYARFAGKAVAPNAADYKVLQDYLFRRIAAECGRLGMAVHLHGMAGGGGYFSVAGVNPMLLEPVLNDPHLRGTRFVLLHGGWPYVREAGALLQKPNVFLDLSQQALIFPPRTLAGWMREWMETYPEKVLFATDGYPYSGAMGWEEATWLASRNVRTALGLALTGMERDGEVSPRRAAELARMVLRGNAAKLYSLPH